jgi:hypothetical protein
MLYKKFISSILIFPLLFGSLHTNPSVAPGDLPAKGFALVELYTSEGCSSCPPADELVGKLSRKTENIIVLSYHVDYWDYLGWKDVYSNPLYSKRQQEYGDYFHLNSVYTPQIIVNGNVEFVGSDEEKLEQSIQKSLGEIPATEIGLQVKQESNRIAVTCITDGIADNELNLALVQKQASDFVQRGENRGKKLNHYFIVRDFLSHPDQHGAHSFYLTLPPGMNSADFMVVAFIQNKKTGHIIAASRSSIS